MALHIILTISLGIDHSNSGLLTCQFSNCLAALGPQLASVSFPTIHCVGGYFVIHLSVCFLSICYYSVHVFTAVTIG